MNTSAYLNRILFHIRENEILEAIGLLTPLLENTPKLQTLLLQESRYREVSSQLLNDEIDYQEGSTTRNKIHTALLDLVNYLKRREEEGTFQPDIKKELAHAISVVGSGNLVNTGSIQAGGDIHIGDTIQTESAVSRRLRLWSYVLVPVLLVLGIIFWQKYESGKGNLTLRVYVKNVTPSSQLNEPEGELHLTVDGFEKILENVTTNQAALIEIPASKKGKPITLSYKAHGFIPTTTTLNFQEEVVIEVRRNEDLAKIIGVVWDEKGTLPLQGVEISIAACCTAYTDEFGEFELSIPFTHQAAEQSLSFTRSGYERLDKTIRVNPNEKIQEYLNKK
ncbi:MAG: hypothetical protein AAF655_28285 [Bacteroidota bacterium]